MSTITFADVVHESVSFSTDKPEDALVLELIDTEWMQRLRDISQTANTRLVYMFSEHSRFGHSIGVAYLAKVLMQKLSQDFPKEVSTHSLAVSAAAILHDIGHLAPGSHMAYKTWFPDYEDMHEQISVKIIKEDEALKKILQKYDPNLPDKVCRVLMEDPSLPPWTWEIISGGGWNVDRGNWCIVDSILAGVSYGKYNIPALIDSIILTNNNHLALKENRLDSMAHFTVSRHAMYRQLYQHRVLLAADMLNKAIVSRVQDLDPTLFYTDNTMKEVLAAKHPSALSIKTIYWMRESWWKYHLSLWSEGKDKILADLSKRLLHRSLFKTLRVPPFDNYEEFFNAARDAVKKAGYDPKYYLHEIATIDMHESDSKHSMLVYMDNGEMKSLFEAEPLFRALVREGETSQKIWLALPKEAKQILGKIR